MMIPFIYLLGLVFIAVVFAAALITLALVIYRMTRKRSQTRNPK
jgi:hypothetical protein